MPSTASATGMRTLACHVLFSRCVLTPEATMEVTSTPSMKV
jgi:hypothetical protein